MRRRWLSVVLLGAALMLPMVAGAHELKANGTIGAVLHVQPNDNATSGQPTSYTLAFRDTTQRLHLSECLCQVVIEQGGRLVSSQLLAATFPLESTNTYTFAEPGVYTLRVQGTPKAAGAFEAFSLAFTLRVTAGGESPMQPFPVLLWIGIALALGLVLLAAYAAEHTTGSTNARNE